MHADGMLEKFVRQVDANRAEISLSVSVRGTVITGRLIGVSDWARELRAVHTGTPLAREFMEGFTGALIEAGDQIRADLKEIEQHGEPVPPPENLHMRNARIVGSDGRMTPAGGMLWRCRLASVDAWTLGELSVV